MHSIIVSSLPFQVKDGSHGGKNVIGSTYLWPVSSLVRSQDDCPPPWEARMLFCQTSKTPINSSLPVPLQWNSDTRNHNQPILSPIPSPLWRCNHVTALVHLKAVTCLPTSMVESSGVTVVHVLPCA